MADPPSNRGPDLSRSRAVNDPERQSYLEQYLAAETKGRLIQSLKSYLTSRTLTTTDVFGRRHSLEDLIARILIDLREQAEQQLGIRIRHAMVGRPVRYVGAETEDDN